MDDRDRHGANRRRLHGTEARDERFDVPGAEILSQDTWADDAEKCPECGAEVAPGDTRCQACGQWLARCSGSCPSCASPRCVGGGR